MESISTLFYIVLSIVGLSLVVLLGALMPRDLSKEEEEEEQIRTP